MESIGNALKSARESQKLSIEEIATTIKINPKIIRAIEDNNEALLPPKIFLRGFIFSYAKYLKLDTDDIMDQFQAIYGSTSKKQKYAHAPETQAFQSDSAQSLPFIKSKSTTTKAVTVVVILVLIGIILGIRNTLNKYESETAKNPYVKEVKSLPEIDPEQKEGIALATDANSNTIKTTENSTDSLATPKDEPKTASPKPTPKPTVVAPKPTPKPPTVAPKPANDLPAVAAKPVKPKETTPPTPKKVEVKKVTPPAKPVATTVPQEVIIEALDDVEISFRIDGGNLQTIKLAADAAHIFKAKGKIAIDISDSGAVNITHNGRDRGVPGDLGKSMKIKYPKK